MPGIASFSAASVTVAYIQPESAIDAERPANLPENRYEFLNKMFRVGLGPICYSHWSLRRAKYGGEVTQQFTDPPGKML
jgi:hypothetical protein